MAGADNPLNLKSVICLAELAGRTVADTRYSTKVLSSAITRYFNGFVKLLRVIPLICLVVPILTLVSIEVVSNDAARESVKLVPAGKEAVIKWALSSITHPTGGFSELKLKETICFLVSRGFFVTVTV
jgi:hypothetical protein